MRLKRKSLTLQKRKMMKISNNSRQSILGKIDRFADSKVEKTDFSPIDTTIYKPIDGTLAECFAAELSAIGSQCHLCATENERLSLIRNFIADKKLNNVYCPDLDFAKKLEVSAVNSGNEMEIDASITDCEALVARTGSVVVSAVGKAGRQFNIYPPIHIICASSQQLFPYLSDALNAVKMKYGEQLPSFISVITGASRTADIEKTLVMGAHGPKEVHVFLLTE